MGRFLGITVKRLAPCRCLDGHVKEPYEMPMALGAQPEVVTQTTKLFGRMGHTTQKILPIENRSCAGLWTINNLHVPSHIYLKYSCM